MTVSNVCDLGIAEQLGTQRRPYHFAMAWILVGAALEADEWDREAVHG